MVGIYIAILNKIGRSFRGDLFSYIATLDYSSINNSNILIEDLAIGVPGPKIAAAPS